MSGYTVIDFETTGLFPGKHDRVVEIGVVQVSENGRIQDEWSTLVNPERDVGPTSIHGITARDVRNAPTFVDVAPYLLHAISGRAITAHNVTFDLRFLAAELDRAGLPVTQRPVPGVCTMRWATRFLPTASRRLVDCSDAADLELTDSHQALADAHAAALLLSTYLHRATKPLPWVAEVTACESYPWPTWSGSLPPVTMMPRSSVPAQRPAAWLDRIVARMPRHEDAGVDAYLDVLESALLDRYLAAFEEDALVDTACELGLSRAVLDEVHREYLRAMAGVALADGVVTDIERAELDRVATILGLGEGDVDVALAMVPSREVNAEFSLQVGDCICLTGDMRRARAEWEADAARHGLTVGGLTKRTRILVAADPDSASGKAEKARRYGIPIVTEDAFAEMLDAMPHADRADSETARATGVAEL